MRPLLFLIFSLVTHLVGCGGVDNPPTDTTSVATPADGFQEDPLSISSFGGNVFAQTETFAAYSFVADRVSIIDPDREDEIWGRRVGDNFSAVFPVPGISAVGLVRAGEFRIVGQDEQISFPLDINLRRWRWARGARAAVFNDQTATDATVLRNRSDGSWEQTTIEYPESAKFDDPGAALITNDGLVVAELFTDDPAFVVYRSTSLDEDLTKDIECEIDIEKLADGVSISDAYSGGVQGDWLLVTFQTEATAINIASGAECPVESEIALTEVVDEGPLRRVLFTEDNLAFLASESGQVVQIAIAEDGAISVAKDFGKLCALPAGLNLISDKLLAVTCVTGFDEDEQVEEVSLLVIDPDTEEEVFEQTIALEKLAGVAIDPENNKLFEFLDGGLGELRITDLDTGESRSKRGLFTDGILDNL